MGEQTSFMQPHYDQQQLQLQLQSTPQIAGQISSQEQLQPPCIEEQSTYKNRLQQVALRANLQLPSYETVNEFRSTVVVDGVKYTSTKTYPTKKAAEQDVAKVALESLSKKLTDLASKNMTDGGFPPIHKDRIFSKSILHEFAAKMKLEMPTYATVRLDGVSPLFVSSFVFDGVKYTGVPSVNKKEAEQLAARAAILSLLANSGSERLLVEIVKSKAKLISAVQSQCNLNTRVSHLPTSGSNGSTSAANAVTTELQQQSASEKAKIPDNANESTKATSDTRSESSLLPVYQTLPEPELVPRYQTVPQPSLLPSTHITPQPSIPPNLQTVSQPSVLPHTQTVSQSSMLSNPPTLPQPSLLPSTQMLPQPSLLQNLQTLSQPCLLPSVQAPCPSSQSILLPSTQTHSQSNWIPSTLIPNLQTLPQPSSTSLQTVLQPSLSESSQAPSQPSSFPSSQALPQSNTPPVTSTPSLNFQLPLSQSASSRKRKNRKNRKANKKATIQVQ